MSKLWLGLGLCLCTLAWAEDDPVIEKPKPVENKNPGVVEMSSGEVPPLPDWRIRQKILLKKLTGPGAALEVMPGFLFDEIRGFPPAWGRGVKGTGKRFANQYGQFALSETIEFWIEAARHEDPRYYRKGEGSIRSRTGNVFKYTFLSHLTDGNPGLTLAAGRLVGTYGAWGIAQRWNPPEQRTVGQFALYGSVGLLSKVGSNALREFLPDVKHRFGKKKPATP